MKIDKLQFSATIPTQQYGNIQPGIELSDVDIISGTNVGMKFIKDLFAKYSEKGGIVEQSEINATAKIKSFTEDIEVDYDPINHVYSREGKILVSATEYIKKFYKPFDADTISSILESKWGIPANSILGLWDENGKITSMFGNVVHATLDYYEKFKEYGEVISSQKEDEDNYCLPKHPILRSIIKGFLELVKNEKGEIVTEKLLTDIKQGMCGTADRIEIIDSKKKICRVKDYKVNVDSEKHDKNLKPLAPFADLPATKITKYQLQLSFYANLLENTGWKVEGLDVYVYEDTWKHFELPVLKVI